MDSDVALRAVLARRARDCLTRDEREDIIREFMSLTAPTSPTDDLAKLSDAATPGPWRHIVGDDYYIESDSYPPRATHNPCVVDTGWWLAVGNRPDDYGEANSKFIVAVVNAYRDGRLVPAPAAPQATDEPVAIPEGWALMPIKPTALMTYMGCEGIIASTKVVERLYEYMVTHRPDAPALYAAPAASRIGVGEEEIARALDLGVCGICKRDCEGSGEGCTPIDCDKRCAWYQPTRKRQIERLLALLTAPRAGGETREIQAWREALDAIHAYVDAHDNELVEANIDRNSLLDYARDLREAIDPCDGRVDRPFPAPPADHDASRREGR